MSEASTFHHRLKADFLSTVSLACLFVIVGVFLSASLTKLRSPTSTRTAARDLGVPAWVGPLVAPAELAVAGLLLMQPRIGSGAAVVLLAAFSVLLQRVLANGRSVRCACFGAGSKAPVNSVSLLRNLGLIVVAFLAGFSPKVNDASREQFGASVAVSLGVLCAGLLVLALADVRRITGSVFPRVRSEL